MSVAAAMSRVERADFLPGDVRGDAGEDVPLAIGHGQTNSQPQTVRIMLELLGVRPGDRVLDVGAGSGWTTALLAELAGPTGTVSGVERIPELARSSAAVIADRYAHASVRLAEPGVLGLPAEGPFDRILVSADSDDLPEQLLAQLGPGGVMVIPVRSDMLRVERTPDEVRITTHGGFRFVPLVRDRRGRRRRR